MEVIRQFVLYRLHRLKLIVILVATGSLVVLSNLSVVNAMNETSMELLRSPGKIKALLKSGKLLSIDVPNPHWQRQSCVACHIGESGFNRRNLRTQDPAQLCGECHNEFSKAAFIHPTGLPIPTDMWRGMPDVFRRSLGSINRKYRKEVTCVTCHDLKIQCLQSRSQEKVFNPNFFRLGPYHNRVSMCFFCHDPSQYKRFSPHKQIVRGKLDKKSCNMCHQNTKKLTSKTRSKDIKLYSSDDLNKLCINCHPTRPHPGWEFAIFKKKKEDVNHLVIPSKEVKRRMEFTKVEIGVELPLDQKNGKIHCATCHNPHEKGVVKSKMGGTGAGSKNRLRIKKPCSYCHDI